LHFAAAQTMKLSILFAVVAVAACDVGSPPPATTGPKDTTGTTTSSSCPSLLTLASDASSQVGDMVQDDNNLYWLSHPIGDTSTWNVNEVYEGGGSATQLATGEPDVHHLVLVGTTLYYLRQTVPQTDPVTWELAALPTDGSQPPTAVVTGISAPDILAAGVDWPPITASSPPPALYFLQDTDQGTSIVSYSTADGSTFAVTDASPTTLVADAAGLYYDDGEQLVELDFATGQLQTLAAGEGGPLIQDRDNVYRVVGDPPTALQVAPKSGSASSSLVTLTGADQLIGAIVTTDGGSVLWEQLGDDGTSFQGMSESEVGWPTSAILGASCPVAPTLGDVTYEAPIVTDDQNVYFTDGTTVYSAPWYTD
jgi:hypothetical protein